jgi:hypothetical protein
VAEIEVCGSVFDLGDDELLDRIETDGAESDRVERGQVARPLRDRRTIPSSGYLVSPGHILTALHAVVDPDKYETVPNEVPPCLVRTVGDLEAKYPGRAWDPKVVARDMNLSSPTRI